MRRLLDIRSGLLFVLAAWLIFNLVQTIQYVVADYSQIPVEDYWRIPQMWGNSSTIQWSNLWVQHNEHRILFPELVYVADMLLLHGRMYLPIAFSGACYLGVWGVLAWTIYAQNAVESYVRGIALLLAGIVICWKGCSTVIATPFQLQFTLLQLASILSLAFLWQLAETGKNRFLAVVITAGGICTYSSGNGMLVWAVLLAAALYLKVALRQVVALCAAAVAFTGAYFYRYHFLPSLISTNIKHPVQGMAFLCSYFSMPFGGYGPRTFGFKVGAANLLLMAVCAVAAGRRGLLRSQLGVVLFGAYLFTLLSAVLTTAGRMDLNDFLFAQAKAWRYVTMPQVSWGLVAIAVVWLTAGLLHRYIAVVAGLGIALFFYVGFKDASDWLETTRLDSANAQVTATMLRNGVFDPEQVRTIFPDPNFVREYARVLQRNRRSIYTHGNAQGSDRWVGGDFSSLPVQNAPVAGKITRVYPVPGGLEIFGWADSKALTDDHEILFVDSHKVIAGFGRRPAAGLPFNLSTWDTPNALAFVGYVSLASPVDSLSVYVRTYHGKSIQPLDQEIAVPPFTQLENRSDAAALPDVSWLPDVHWTVGGYTVDPENGPPPPGVIYASWSGSDANTGTLKTDSFATPQNGCLVLPVLHGRSTYGQTVKIRDANTGQTIANLPALDGRTIWERWKITIPGATHNLVIVADDEGTGLNQWVAIATPERCP